MDAGTSVGVGVAVGVEVLELPSEKEISRKLFDCYIVYYSHQFEMSFD